MLVPPSSVKKASTYEEPTSSYQSASWTAAMETELHNLQEHRIAEFVKEKHAPPYHNAIGIIALQAKP